MPNKKVKKSAEQHNMKVSRVYRRKNTRVKRALKFQTKSQKRGKLT